MIASEADADDIRDLPDEKLEEIARKVAGEICCCPQCGEYTAFVGSRGHNSWPTCHNCDHREGVVG